MKTKRLKDLKRQLSIGRVLEAYGLCTRLKQHGNQLVGACPLHGGDNPTAFRVHLTRGIYNCFTACGGGDTVDLICNIEKCTKASAARIIRHMIASTAISGPLGSDPLPQRSSTTRAFRPFRRKIPLNPRTPFLQDNKGISVHTAIRFETGLADPKSSFLRGAVAVRLHDIKGHPIGYCARRLDPHDISRWGKWRFPTGLPKRQLLYNAHRALATRHHGIVVVECPWAAMRLTQAGVSFVVALLGTTMTQTQLAWIASAPAVLLLMDADTPGKKAAKTIAQALDRNTTALIHHLPPEKEPEDLQDANLLSLVANAFPFFLNPPFAVHAGTEIR
jgi:DNA primase